MKLSLLRRAIIRWFDPELEPLYPKALESYQRALQEKNEMMMPSSPRPLPLE